MALRPAIGSAKAEISLEGNGLNPYRTFSALSGLPDYCHVLVCGEPGRARREHGHTEFAQLYPPIPDTKGLV